MRPSKHLYTHLLVTVSALTVPIHFRAFRALAYGTTVFLSFFLMLVFMTYNVRDTFTILRILTKIFDNRRITSDRLLLELHLVITSLERPSTPTLTIHLDLLSQREEWLAIDCVRSFCLRLVDLSILSRTVELGRFLGAASSISLFYRSLFNLKSCSVLSILVTNFHVRSVYLCE